MALVKCDECGHGVSTKAAACPNCGAPPPKPSPDGLKNIFNFYKSFLRYGYFCNENLENVIFTKANLDFANFNGAHLKNANFDNADLSRSDFGGAVQLWGK